jgi:hypothetical protein
MIDRAGWQQLKWRRATILLAALLCLLMVGLRTPTPAGFILDGDWAYQLTAGNQVLTGEHPFIDFKGGYGPLVFYASAAAQALSGRRPIGEILLVVAGYVVGYVVLFCLFWRAGGNRAAAMVVLLVALALLPRLYKYHIVLGPALTLAAAWRHVDRGDTRSLWVLAAAVAFTGLFRPDFGAYAAVAGAVAVWLTAAHPIRPRRLLSFAAATTLCALPWLIYVLVRGGLLRYFRDSTIGLAVHASRMSLPIPRFDPARALTSVENGIFFTFLLFNVLPVLTLIVLWRSRKELADPGEGRKMLVAVVLAQANMLQGLHRPGYNHILQAVPISFVLVAWLIGRARSAWASGARPRRIRAAGAVVALILSGLVVCAPALRRGQPLRTDARAVLEDLRLYAGPTAPVVQALAQGENRWILDLVLYIRSHSRPDERILILPFTLTNLYYFSDRAFAGGQQHLAPGNASTEADQKRIVEHLSRQDVALVIDIPGFGVDGLEARRLDRFAPVLWGYLEETFVEVARFGPALVSTRRPDPQ